jgi:hypothetical protein
MVISKLNRKSDKWKPESKQRSNKLKVKPLDLGKLEIPKRSDFSCTTYLQLGYDRLGRPIIIDFGRLQKASVTEAREENRKVWLRFLESQGKCNCNDPVMQGSTFEVW